MKVELIIWDFDGTLANTFPITFESINDAIEPFIGRRMPNAEIMPYFGQPDDEIVKTIVGQECESEAVAKLYEAMPRYVQRLRLFDGIEEVLRECHSHGIKLALLTGRGKVTTHLMIAALGIKDEFSMILTGNEVARVKPHPDGPLQICGALTVKPQNTLMIGDTVADALAAKSAGMHFIACTWDAYCEPEKLSAAGAERLINEPRELHQFLFG